MFLIIFSILLVFCLIRIERQRSKQLLSSTECETESKEFEYKNMSSDSICEQQSEQMNCNSGEECENQYLIKKYKPRIESNDTSVDKNWEKINKSLPSDKAWNEENADKLKDPIEEFRTDVKEWQDFHTMASTPTSLNNTLPELNISSIIIDDNDSELLFERQISRFQFTDERISSLDIQFHSLSELSLPEDINSSDEFKKPETNDSNKI